MASHVIVTAVPPDVERSVATMVTAFSNDPFVRWMLPEPEQYLTYFTAFSRLFAAAASQNESAYRSQDFMSAAFWLPPNAHPDGQALGEMTQAALAEDVRDDVYAVLGKMGESHPEEEHWYLPLLGVDPARQGMGYGSALLAHSLQACDAAHLPAYLESTNLRNIPLYERYGFKVTGEIQVGSSPTIWPMLREAR